MTPEDLETIAAAISDVQRIDFKPLNHQPVYGGDINQCFILTDGQRRYFVKTNERRYSAMLETERDSLQRLQATDAMPIPKPITCGTTGSLAFLVLSHHNMRSSGDDRALARGLAALHRSTSPDGRYGWHQNNYIGTTPQHNQWHSSWCDFWREERLRPQLELAYSAGFTDDLQPLAQKLIERLPELLGDHQPEASLLHGDLWGGNAAFLESGEPIVYDPASYYGDRETDLAMTELFGGFSREFHREYQTLWPLPPAYEVRKQLYKLYHLLNHLNLFGRGYLGQCRNTLAFLRENVRSS